MGLTATVDLTQRCVTIVPTPEAELDRFLGGRGLGLSLLWQHVRDPLDPFGPDNPLIFTVGPFTGTSWPAGARGHVTFHSPLTGIYGYANSGGHFWAALAHCGFDALVVLGQGRRAGAARRDAGRRRHPAGGRPVGPDHGRDACAAKHKQRRARGVHRPGR